MKYEKLSLCSVSALAFALSVGTIQAANAHELYKDGDRSLHAGGRLFALYQSYDEHKVNKDGTTHQDAKGVWTNTNARINFSGEHRLQNDSKIIAMWEREFKNDEEYDEQRAMWIGIDSSEYGRLQFGREENVLWNVRTMADIVQESIFDGRRIVGALDGKNWWSDNTLAYKIWKKNFDFSAAYVFEKGSDREGVSSFNASGKYKTDFGFDIGLGVVLGDEKEYDQKTKTTSKDEDQKQYWLGLQYKIDNLTLGIVNSRATIKDSVSGRDDVWQDMEASVAYQLDKLKFGVVYAKRETDKKGTDNFRGFTGKFTETNALNFGVSYKILDNFSAFAVLGKNDSDTSDDTKWHVGLEYWL